MQGSSNSQVLNSLVELDYMRKIFKYQKLAGMSEVDLVFFCDHDRAHMKEGIITVEEDSGVYYNLKLQQVAVQLLYGKKVRADDLLKISQTSLEGILALEFAANTNSVTETIVSGNDVSSKSKARKRPRDAEVGESVELDVGSSDDNEGQDGEFVSHDSTPSPSRKLPRASNGDELGAIRVTRTPSFRIGVAPHTPSGLSNAPSSGIALHRQLSHNSYFGLQGARGKSNNGLKSMLMATEEDEEESDTNNDSNSHNEDLTQEEAAAKTDKAKLDATSLFASSLTMNPKLVTSADDGESSIKPYDSKDQLDYLEDGFQLISLMIKTNSAKLKDDLKKEGTSNANMWHDGGAEQKFSNRELSAKIRLLEKRIAARLRKTEEAGLPLPRLEGLMAKFSADVFEKRLVLLMIGLTVSPIVRTLVDNMKSGHIVDPSISVGEALSILCQDFRSQLTHRRYFYQSSCLLVNGVVSLYANRWREAGGDLTENRLALDRRILDWAVGLDSEINELVQGSDLYDPVVQLNQVILPRGYIERILSLCYSYDDYALHQEHQQQHNHEKMLSYGNSLVILLCGKSGTGKTMTVNAVAKELKKKVLLVDFQSLLSRRGNNEAEVDLKGLFREAKMSNAVLFFDECETIFRGRHVGADRTLNSLLTEMERHTGIVFLATNRPHEIDEAMHRRITMVLEYREPTVAMRKLIWDNLLGNMQSSNNNIAVAANEIAVGSPVEHMYVDSGNGAALVESIKREKQLIVQCISVHDEVETSVLAAKYQLTGGFIKNAVLSATLIAMSRNKEQPVITQDDLIEGSKMQMRGNLSRNVFRIIPTDTGPKKTLKDLFVPETTKMILQKIIQFESTRSKIYGTWNFTTSAPNGTDHASENGQLQATVQQHACINLLAGSRGSGKSTVLRTVASELGGRKLKYVHVAELASDNIAASTETFHALVLDASILDAIIVIDGFEQILETNTGESGSSTLHLLLSRLMDILYTFPGCIFLLAHIENPQNMELKRDFASRLFSFIRMTMPPYDIRASLWRSLLPKAAPLSADLDFAALGRRFELFPVSIEAAIAFACSEVASRSKNPTVMQQDLLSAGEREVKKLRSNNFDIVSGLFN
jgi:SpoVK/Ycf46/Vps4 family AAA+-type ATPase